MPHIFTVEKREKIKIDMLENGFAFIKQNGLRRTSVSDVAKASGVATGSFYNFFKSKEEFVYQIILYKRSFSKQKFQELVDKYGVLSREQFKEFLTYIFYEDNNIFEYLTHEEIAMLYSRWPKEYIKNENTDENITSKLLEYIQSKNSECNWKVFANLCKSVSLIRYGKENLYAEAYDEMMGLLIETALNYVFGVK